MGNIDKSNDIKSYVDSFINVVDFSIKKQLNENSDCNEYRFVYDYKYFLDTIGITAGSIYAKWDNLEQDIISSVEDYYAKNNYDCIVQPNMYKQGKTLVPEKINIILIPFETNGVITNVGNADDIDETEKESEVKVMSRQRITKEGYAYIDKLWNAEFIESYKFAVTSKDGKPRNLKQEFKSAILAKFFARFPVYRKMNAELLYKSIWSHILKLPEMEKIRKHNKNYRRHTNQQVKASDSIPPIVTVVADSGINCLSGTKDVELIEPESINPVNEEPEPKPVDVVPETTEFRKEPMAVMPDNNIDYGYVTQPVEFNTPRVVYTSKFKKYRVRVDVVYKLGVFGKHVFTFDNDVIAEDAIGAWTDTINLLDRLKGNASSVNIKYDTKLVEEIKMLD